MPTGKTHRYSVSVEWTGNRGSGTSAYRAYSRDHTIGAGSKPTIAGSSDPAFLGDAARWNPEDLIVASVSACHKLWYLHLAAEAGVIVTAYVDRAEGVMVEDAERGGYFTGITLHPEVTVSAASDPAEAQALHAAAHHKCFVANSLNFPVACEATVTVASA
jgi:organic hydroperoxide reductase OsmC/OhrA